MDTAFLCTPNEVSYELAPKLLARGIRVVDFSGSFRLRDAISYPSWYGFKHDEPDLLRQAVYGLAEWNGKAIAGARLVANPGCYPTSVLLPLLPLVKADLVAPGSDIICDSKSGVTGAGRGARLDVLFAEVSENFRPYNPGARQHLLTHRKIWQQAGTERIAFVPHLLPVNRGILSTMYLAFQRAVSSQELQGEYERRYRSRPFVRVLGATRLPELRAVKDSNFCDIAWRLTHNGTRAVIFSAIDNLVKGAAGQAVQNFNLMHGLDESMALLEGEPVAIHG